MERSISLNHIVKNYFQDISDCKIRSFGSGLIHRTFFLEHTEGDFILQKINHQVFANPEIVMQNIQSIGDFLLEKNYPKAILKILPTLDGSLLLKNKNEFWRCFYFIKDTQYFSNATSEKQVYDTGKSFGEFLTYLKDFPIEKITASIPNFHNPSFRLQQFENAIKKNPVKRVQNATLEIEEIKSYLPLIKQWNTLKFPIRVVHADPKINNLLFDKNENVVAVIDWDTMMPGNILFDFGDLVRTMACTENEESTNFENVKIDPVFYKNIKKGFLEMTGNWLSEIEKEHLKLGVKMIILEQAIRFLTDFITGDVYYKTDYQSHNLERTRNQLTLLKSFEKT